jgi:glycosyltransferase involved in cell wall biosynthesis
MLELGVGLESLGHEVVICAHQFEPGTIDPEIEQRFEIRAARTGPIEIPLNDAQSLKRAWIDMRELAKVVPNDVDVLNVHEAPAHMAGWYARRRGVRPVVWTRNDATLYELAKLPEESWLPPSGRARNLVRIAAGQPDRIAARGIDQIVVLDERNRRMVREAYDRDARIVRSGAAQKFFDAPTHEAARAQLGIAADEFAVLAVGILIPYRRHEDIVSAVALIDDARLRVIGSDHVSPETAQALRAQVDAAGLTDRVELIQDAVSDAELVAHFAAADAFVFANELQTWGLAPLEAIAAGTPVIVSRGAGVHEVLGGRPGVQLVDTRSPKQIAEALERIRRDRSAFDVAATREWSHAELASTTFATRMAELFEELA